jgi:hypothetical protein
MSESSALVPLRGPSLFSNASFVVSNTLAILSLPLIVLSVISIAFLSANFNSFGATTFPIAACMSGAGGLFLEKVIGHKPHPHHYQPTLR